MSQPDPPSQSAPLTYAQSGVDVGAADRAVDLMRAAVTATHGPSVLGGLGGFAGMVDARALAGMRHPVLVTSTDGVGTKVAIAQAMDRHHTIGQDLVGMVVDDIVVTGARPLFMTDYIACGRLDPDRIASIVTGIARACEATGTALVGGETAEHPGLLAPQEYDVAGAVTGVVEYEDVLGAHRVQDGDALVAMGSSGLHSNGFSLVRRIVERAGWSLTDDVAEFGRPLGAELLEPTRLYTGVCLELAAGLPVHAFSHVTGGGLAANLARVLPAGLNAVVDRGTWALPTVMAVLARAGQVPGPDLEQTFNLGVGMVAVLPADAASRAVDTCERAGIPAWVCGHVTTDDMPDAIRGAKGVDGGGVLLAGQFQ